MENIEFQKRINENKKPVVVSIWAPLCSRCMIMDPFFKQASKKYQDTVDTFEISAYDSQELLSELKVMSVPTFISFTDGVEVYRRTGMQTATELDSIFTAAVSKQKPGIIPHTTVDRIVWTMVGLATFLLGWFYGRPNPFILLGSLFLGCLFIFYAFYDRCPIYKAVIPRLKSIFQRSK